MRWHSRLRAGAASGPSKLVPRNSFVGAASKISIRSRTQWLLKSAFFGIERYASRRGTNRLPKIRVDALDRTETKRSGCRHRDWTRPTSSDRLATRLGIDSFVEPEWRLYLVLSRSISTSKPSPSPVWKHWSARLPLTGTRWCSREAMRSSPDVEDHPHVFEAVSSLRVELPGFDPEYWRKQEIFQAFLRLRTA